ncbi:MAG TPA: hypothetical protein VG406_23525 [Isosphaeraceae bacterium]|nr:hypothetical protein [Isosphaeraceae bacterium]
MFGHTLRRAVLGVGMTMAIVGFSSATAQAQAGPPIRSARMAATTGLEAGGMGASAFPERTTYPIRGLGAGAEMPNNLAGPSGRLPNPFRPYPYPYPFPYPYPYPYPHPPVTPYGWWPSPWYGTYYQINIPYYPPGLF